MINNQKIRNRISQYRAEGKTNNEIYSILYLELKDDKLAANLIVTTPEKQYLEKYKMLKLLTFGFLFLALFFFFLQNYQTWSAGLLTDSKFAVYTAGYVVLLIVAVALWKNEKSRFGPALFFVGLIMANGIPDGDAIWFLAGKIATILMFATSIYYHIKVLPFASFYQAKKAKDGTYILGD